MTHEPDEWKDLDARGEWQYVRLLERILDSREAWNRSARPHRKQVIKALDAILAIELGIKAIFESYAAPSSELRDPLCNLVDDFVKWWAEGQARAGSYSRKLDTSLNFILARRALLLVSRILKEEMAKTPRSRRNEAWRKRVAERLNTSIKGDVEVLPYKRVTPELLEAHSALRFGPLSRLLVASAYEVPEDFAPRAAPRDRSK